MWQKGIIIGVLLLITIIFSGCLNSPNEAIAGGYWLIAYGNPSSTTPALEDVTTSIRFNLDGTFNGNMGCNSFSGKYTVDGNKLTISNLASTEMYCEKTSAQETAVLNILSSDNLHFLSKWEDGHPYLTITSDIGVIILQGTID